MTTFSPVTESEMQDFLTRALATIKDYTQLSSRLEGFQQDIDSLRGRLETVSNENNTLRNDIKAATDLAGQAEQERDEARRNHQEQVARSNNLQDLITARDSRVTELTKDIEIINKDRGDLNRECNNLNSRVASLESDLEHTSQRRDYWQKIATDNERNLKEALSDLKEVQDMVGRLAIFKPKEEPKKVDVPITEGKPEEPRPFESSNSQTESGPSNTSAPEMKPVIHEDDFSGEPVKF